MKQFQPESPFPARKPAFFFLLLLLIGYRIVVLLKFGIRYTDQDQAVLWQGVKDFSQGIFHEPRFYGQAYNSMLEALLAVLPYKAGVPVYVALPLVTTLLALLPFVVFGALAFFRRKNDAGLLILLLPLLLPLNYDILTTLPRGFVTGIALCSVSMLFFEDPKKWKFPLFSFFLVLGFICNANSLLLSLPLFACYFIENRKNPWYYAGTLIGLTAGYFICFQMDLFYLHHPEFAVHRPEGKFEAAYFKTGLLKIDAFFGDLSPIAWGKGMFTLFCLLALNCFLWLKKQRAQAVILFGALAMIFLTLFNSRLYNASDSIFYSYSRMFLAVPVLLATGLYFLNVRLQIKWLIGIAVLAVVIKTALLPQRLDSVLETTFIYAAEVDSTLRECERLEAVARANDAGLIIISDFHHIIYNYACDCGPQKFTPVLFPAFERRTWRLREEHANVHRNVIVIDEEHHYQDSAWLQQLEGNNRWFVVKNNVLPTSKLLERLGIQPREY